MTIRKGQATVASDRYDGLIEPSASCHINCTLCPLSRRELKKSPAAFMPLDLAERCMRRMFDEFGVRSVAFGNWGEPLLHPQIFEFFRLADSIAFEGIYASTTFSVETNVDGLVESGLRYLDISMSGLTAEIYQKAHRRGNIDLVLENIDRLFAYREQTRSELKVGLRWHRYTYNECQMDQARELCERYRMSFKPYFATPGSIETMADWRGGRVDRSLHEFIEESLFTDFIRMACEQNASATDCPQRRRLTIHADGKLLHCCTVHSSYERGRDFLSMSIDEIEEFKTLTGPYCRECLARGWAGYWHGGKAWEAYRDDADEESDWKKLCWRARSVLPWIENETTEQPAGRNT